MIRKPCFLTLSLLGLTGLGVPSTARALSPSTSAVAFQGSTGSLWESGPDYTGVTSGWIAPTTSPSIAEMEGGNYQDVFQGADGYLWINNIYGPRKLGPGYGMGPNSSPSIAGLPNGGYVIAFQANTTFLWVVGNAGVLQQNWYGMMPGTSPSITALPGGGWQAAFQANTGNLWVTGTLGSWDTGKRMRPGTSPSIAATPDSNWVVAYEDIGGNLYMYGSAAMGDTGYGMQNTSSPSISPIPTGGFVTAFQANNGTLFVVGASGVLQGNVYGMAPGTSPSVTALMGGGWQAAFQSNTNHYWLAGTQVTGDTNGLMRPGTSPSICPVYPKPKGLTARTFVDSTVTTTKKAAVTFSWNPVPGATSYRLNCWENIGGYNYSLDGANGRVVTGTSYTYRQVEYSAGFFFNLKACYPNGLCGKSSDSIRITSAADPGKTPPPPPPPPTTGVINMNLQLELAGTSCGTSNAFVDGAIFSSSVPGYVSGTKCNYSYSAMPVSLKRHWACMQSGSYCCTCVPALTSSVNVQPALLYGNNCIYTTPVAPSSCQ